MATVDDFKAKLIGGGARPNLFRAIINFPAFAGGNSELTSFMVKSAQIPDATVGNIPVNFRGRQVQIAGDRAFAPINLMVINDANFDVRNAFERWMNGIGQNQANKGLSNPSDYKVDWILEQLNKEQEVIKTYRFRGAYPTQVGAIDLSYDSENTIEEFSVELQTDYWESAGTTT